MSNLQNIEHSGLSIKAQVIADIESFALEKQITVRELIKEMSNTSGIVLRNLERIVGKGKSTPSNETLIKIYSYFYNTSSVIDLLIKTPEVIANSIRSYLVISDKNKISTKISNEIINLSGEDVFNSIYLMTSGDFGTDLDHVKDEYGKFGLEMVEKMLFSGILKIDENERLIRKDSILSLAEIRQNMLSTIVKKYDPKINQIANKDYLGVFMGDVTVEDFNEIMIDTKAFFSGIGDKISKSKPTLENCKKLALGGVLKDLEIIKDGDIQC